MFSYNDEKRNSHQRERRSGNRDSVAYKSYRSDNRNYHRGGDHRDDRIWKPYRDEYSRSNNNRYNNRDRANYRDSRKVSPTNLENNKPIPIDLRPSGILTKYLHLTSTSSAGSELTANDVRSKYAPPNDEIIPTSDNCNIHLFKYNEDADKQIEIPLYNFKSYFVFGRDEELADIVIPDEEDGDLVSKQHAILQFRKSRDNAIKCYLMDIGSTNGTFLNDDKVELPSKRYIELKNNDVFKLGDHESIIEFMLVEDN